jgi:hypothetical protein
MSKIIPKSLQVKSKQRVTNHGEVFTNSREVHDMLDLVKNETERIESRFLEPACGNGNFLTEVLKKKLDVIDKRYHRIQSEWERNSVIAVSTIYGIDILLDNTKECRSRLFDIFTTRYSNLYGDKTNKKCNRSVKYILNRNILWGDALDFTNPETKQPLIFSEWTPINGTMIKRRDFMFRFLVEKTFQISLFNDEGVSAGIDEPIKEFPLINYLNIGEYDATEL